MDLRKIQELIDSTEYWDEVILDLKFHYFGDVIDIIVKKNAFSSWLIRFSRCIKVLYVTDAEWRGDIAVSDMTESQKGYFGQKIDVSLADTSDIYEVDIDLTILDMKITCYEIEVKEINAT